jgi:hypothetical protein
VDTNLGVDCGGFVANYWGLTHVLEMSEQTDDGRDEAETISQ